MNTDALSKVLSGTVVCLNILAFSLYIPNASPNTAAWSLWAGITVIGAFSYMKMTGDPVKNFPALVNIFITIPVFVYFAIVGKFQAIGYLEYILFGIGIFACFVWWWYRSATYAQMIIQAVIAIGYISNVTSVWANPGSEPAYPWFIWTLCSITMGAVVILRWQKWQDIIGPTNSTLFSFIIATLALRA